MSAQSLRVAALLFCSGLCALVYQSAWLRELRLVFGASTPASAAVLAVFMAGLGFGSHLLSRRADAAERPLRLYAHLELGIAATAAVSPFLLDFVRFLYVKAGGSVALGSGLGTVVRLLLSALVLLPPTLLMGGTLPAAARAATGDGDTGRRATALLYGLNTLGAVTGAALTTFVLLEVYGVRYTLWLGCAANGLVGMAARLIDRTMPAPVPAEPAPPKNYRDKPGAKAFPNDATVAASFVLGASACVGFAFFVLELVWYRMLSPLLGGSSYTFGLILAVALFGIGAGGLLYTLRGADRAATVPGFALTCALEALCIAVPYALGDRIAILAMFLRTFGTVGLSGHVIGWTVVTAVVVLPAAIVAGYQFPMLIALLGRGGSQLGRHVGVAYAFNTIGAIAGSLAGGFFLMPMLSAPGVWRLTVWMLIALGAVAMVLHVRAGGRWTQVRWPLIATVLGGALLVGSLGPTAVWRHMPIGAGRADHYVQNSTRNELRRVIYEKRSAISWEADGRESSIGLHAVNDTSFFVNGKSDGAAANDSGTQVMGGLLGALLHQKGVKTALVVGLGTGSTAGWLGALPDIERVDVVELEPAILHVADVCTPVNHDVLRNPKVHIHIGDAREVLLTTPRRYDLIFSEPSNPYRAGIASLFTQEFYRAVHERLNPDGMFVQWLQAYEIDAMSVRTVYATLGSVFPSVESWRTKTSDLVLISRDADVPVDVDQIRKRIREQPYRDALAFTWRANSVEDVLARYVARPSLARAIVELDREHGINTDDRNLLEFSIARALGRPQDFSVESLMDAARPRGETLPVLVGERKDKIDWGRASDMGVSLRIAEGSELARPQDPADEAAEHRYRAHNAWVNDDFEGVLSAWDAQPQPPRNLVEMMIVADALAVTGKEEAALRLADALEKYLPGEADGIRAKLYWALSRHDECWDATARAVERYRWDPWPNNQLMSRVLPLVLELARLDAKRIPGAWELLGQEYAVRHLEYLRNDMRVDLALLENDGPACVEAHAAWEPWPHWTKDFLARRLRCYELAGHPRAERAKQDLADFLADAGVDFGEGLPQPDAPAAHSHE